MVSGAWLPNASRPSEWPLESHDQSCAKSKPGRRLTYLGFCGGDTSAIVAKEVGWVGKCGEWAPQSILQSGRTGATHPNYDRQQDVDQQMWNSVLAVNNSVQSSTSGAG